MSATTAENVDNTNFANDLHMAQLIPLTPHHLLLQ